MSTDKQSSKKDDVTTKDRVGTIKPEKTEAESTSDDVTTKDRVGTIKPEN